MRVQSLWQSDLELSCFWGWGSEVPVTSNLDLSK